MWPENLESSILGHLHRRGRLTRSELHELTGVRPNTVGDTVKSMLDKGLLREGEMEILGPGRPRAPLHIDDVPWRVVGLALERGQVSVCRMTPRGDVAGRHLTQPHRQGQDVVRQAEVLLRQALDPQVLAIGVSVPGFVDPQRRTLLLSAATPGQPSVDLTPLYEAANGRAMVLENDMHAVAARWLLENAATEQDVLLVSLDDGAIGSAMLIDGKPNRGCIVGGNELGHMRFAVETDRCHCGQTGCLARVFSTAFLHRHGPANGTLAERAARYDGGDAALDIALEHLTTGLSNIINFVRPNRVMLISGMSAHAPFDRAIKERTRAKLMPGIDARVVIESWNQPLQGRAVNAGWLALAALFQHEWRQDSFTRAAGASLANRRRYRAASPASVPA